MISSEFAKCVSFFGFLVDSLVNPSIHRFKSEQHKLKSNILYSNFGYCIAKYNTISLFRCHHTIIIDTLTINIDTFRLLHPYYVRTASSRRILDYWQQQPNELYFVPLQERERDRWWCLNWCNSLIGCELWVECVTNKVDGEWAEWRCFEK